MRMVKVDGHRVCLVRTAGGVHALDHACPHEGYGLTQGELNGDLLTCAWHNWKFRVTDGACVQGEEGVTVHRRRRRRHRRRPGDDHPPRSRGRAGSHARQPAPRHRQRLHGPGGARRRPAAAGQREPRRVDLGGRRPRCPAGRVRLGPLDRLGDRLPVDDRPVRRRPARPADRAGDHGHRRVGARSARQRVARAGPRRRSDPHDVPVGGRIRTDGRRAGARARGDRAGRHGGRTPAMVHRRRQRSPALVRPRRDLHPEGVRTPRR